MEMEKLNFEKDVEFEGASLADVAKNIEEKILAVLVDETEMPKDDYVSVVAKILFSKFGCNREKSYSEYLVCESVAMAIALRGLPNGRFEPFREKFFREEIRSAINGLEDEAKN